MEYFEIMRFIEIDAAHRVPEHGSKCRNLHGHRYKVEAHCWGPLAPSGEQGGMVMDFSFLKDTLMQMVDEPCDHGLILRFDDPILATLEPEVAMEAGKHIRAGGRFYKFKNTEGLKLYIIPFVPTAEWLAAHWFNMLYGPILQRSDRRAVLVKVQVWETPNCWATYPSLNSPRFLPLNFP